LAGAENSRRKGVGAVGEGQKVEGIGEAEGDDEGGGENLKKRPRAEDAQAEANAAGVVDLHEDGPAAVEDLGVDGGGGLYGGVGRERRGGGYFFDEARPFEF
jgi:hypothetical protein